MEASAISETLFMLAGRLQYLRVFFEHYEVGSPRGLLDQEFDRSVEAATYVVNGALESFKSTEFGPAHWETERRLRYVSRELRELIDRLDRIRDAVGVYSVSTDDMWHHGALRLSTSSAITAALEFAQQDVLVTEQRLFALAKYYSSDALLEDETTVSDLDLEVTLAHYDRLRPEDVLHAAGVDWNLAKGEGAETPDEQAPRAIPCRLVPVMFATERKKIADSPSLHVRYADGRSGRKSLSYGVAEVSIPRGRRHKKGRLERPTLWKLQFREDPEKHVTIVTSEEKDLSAWKAIAAERLRDAGTHAALVFVHGFNVSFDDAIRRSGQIGWDLQFHGLIAAFSWCSQGEVLSYFTDESNARLAVPRFVEFLRVLRDEVGISTIHVIAHSMGNLVLVEALRKMSSLGDQQLLLEEVVLAAPDLDADEFKAAVQEIAGKAKRYTLYGSEDDKALAASKKLRSNYPRAGDGGEHLLVVEGVESIDATSVGEDLFGLGHSYFASKRTVLSDLYYVIKESLPPWRRDGLDEAHVGSLRYWVFVP